MYVPVFAHQYASTVSGWSVKAYEFTLFLSDKKNIINQNELDKPVQRISKQIVANASIHVIHPNRPSQPFQEIVTIAIKSRPMFVMNF